MTGCIFEWPQIFSIQTRMSNSNIDVIEGHVQRFIYPVMAGLKFFLIRYS